MPTVRFSGHTLECPHGANLRMVLLRARLPLYNSVARALNCRGFGTCGTCAVRIEGKVSDLTTAERMRAFDAHAPDLAVSTVERLNLGSERDSISHVLITCCTGFSAPGLDFHLIERCGLPSSVERVMIGFMGCYAAINALKAATSPSMTPRRRLDWTSIRRQRSSKRALACCVGAACAPASTPPPKICIPE